MKNVNSALAILVLSFISIGGLYKSMSDIIVFAALLLLIVGIAGIIFLSRDVETNKKTSSAARALMLLAWVLPICIVVSISKLSGSNNSPVGNWVVAGYGGSYLYIKSNGTLTNGLGSANGGGSCSWEMIDDQQFRTYNCSGRMTTEEGVKWRLRTNDPPKAIINLRTNLAYKVNHKGY
jgi:hypothetical protein